VYVIALLAAGWVVMMSNPLIGHLHGKPASANAAHRNRHDSKGDITMNRVLRMVKWPTDAQ
jgi:hypothetical protein